MASPGSPAARAMNMDDLLQLHKSAVMLKTMLEGSPTPASTAAERGLTEGMMSRLTSMMSGLNTGDGRASSYAGAGRGSGGPHRRRSSTSSRRRSRTLSPFLKTVITNKLDDGHAWRKYGQKHIQDSDNPRSYYRCTHMPDQGCKARKQVQVSDTNPSEYIVSYFGQHTCRDPSTLPLVIEAATAPLDSANFICFGSATETCVHAVPHRQAIDPTMVLSRLAAGCSSSLPAKERCGSEEVISSSISSSWTGQLGDVVGSAPEYCWTSELEGAGGIGTGSFPSSPSSLGGFMASSFGSFGNGMDDDLFSFDP